MKKLLPALLLLLLALASCKKERTAGTISADNTATAVLQYPGQITITKLSPATVSEGTMVTISGTNFGTYASLLTVLFNGKIAPIQSITATEIKVKVSPTTSGNVAILTSNGQTFTGPAFTYVSSALLIAPYVSGDVTLNTQADVDAFATVNKGQQLKITGNLTIGGYTVVNSAINYSDITSVAGLSNITSISGTISFSYVKLAEAPFLDSINAAGGISIYSSGFTKLSFNNLKSFSGNLFLSILSDLTNISFNGLTTVNNLYIFICPLVTDLSFLNNITSAGSIYLNSFGATKITMDNLTRIIPNNLTITAPTNSIIVTPAGLTIVNIENLNNISLKSLTTISGRLYIGLCQQLSNVNFNNLASVSDKLTLSVTNLTDLNGFSALQTLGSITLSGNPALINLHGLEHLTTLNSPAIDPTNVSSAPVSRFGGIYIGSNAKLTSLSGLQNITTVPIVYISGNTILNDFCPLKMPINVLSTSPAYSYRIQNPRIDGAYVTTSTPALTLTKNGNYATTPDALAAVALCK
ncbi:MAG: hypothetical protein EOP45_01705 [Sphingobacteriaceae bacterium]|nr:MAG: hypothetical protein EOP45_01705 [Sphingobacteriaceae bacterium]